MMFSVAISAIRNPKAHENITISKDDAIRKLMLASMLMYKLEAAQLVPEKQCLLTIDFPQQHCHVWA